MNKKRILYILATIASITLGLISRRLSVYFPDSLNLVLGDTLWAMMIYFGMRFVFIRKTEFTAFVLALAFCFAVELSQLYHGVFIDSVRNTRIGGLVLGYGFLWSDLAAYSVGTGLGYSLDRFRKSV